MANLSLREKFFILVVVASIGYLVYDFFIRKSATDTVKAGENIAVSNNLRAFKQLLMDQGIEGEGAKGLTNFDDYVITRAQSDWVRDPFPDKDFFSKPLMTIEEAIEARKIEALIKPEKEGSEAIKREALIEAVKKEAVQIKAEKLRYSGYIYMGTFPIAIIKGMEYLAGDEVDGFIIKKIDHEMVTLQDKDNGYVITLQFDEEMLGQK